MQFSCDFEGGNVGRGLHSSTFQLNFSTICGLRQSTFQLDVSTFHWMWWWLSWTKNVSG